MGIILMWPVQENSNSCFHRFCRSLILRQPRLGDGRPHKRVIWGFFVWPAQEIADLVFIGSAVLCLSGRHRLGDGRPHKGFMGISRVACTGYIFCLFARRKCTPCIRRMKSAKVLSKSENFFIFFSISAN